MLSQRDQFSLLIDTYFLSRFNTSGYLFGGSWRTRIWREKIRAARMRKTGQWNLPNRVEPYLKKILTNFKNYLLVPFVLQLCQFCLRHNCTAVHTNKISVLNIKRWYGSCNKVDEAICNTLSITMLQRVPLI